MDHGHALSFSYRTILGLPQFYGEFNVTSIRGSDAFSMLKKTQYTERQKPILRRHLNCEILCGNDWSVEKRGGSMKHRIALWAGAGALIVVLWTLYISTTSTTSAGIVRTLAYLSCPISLADHHALNFYFVLLFNAATYAMVGAVVETVRRVNNQTRVMSN
jgi:hypothetical protein